MNIPWWIIELVLAAAAAGMGVLGALIYKRYKPSTSRAANGGTARDETNENSFWFGLGYSGAAVAAAILIPLLLWAGLLGIKHFLPATDSHADSLTNASIMVTLVVIASVIGLLAVLMMTALAFSSVKLSDSTQALGLPEGSVRAVIALSLIVIFVIIVVFLFGRMERTINQIEHLTLAQTNAISGELVASKHREDPEYEAKKQEAAESQKQLEDLRKRGAPEGEVKPAEDKAGKAAAAAADEKRKGDEANPATKLYTVERFVEPSRSSEDFAKQVITTISTLVVSLAAFYFGSTTAISAAKSGAASGAPVITKQPADLNLKVGDAAKFNVGATGSNLSYQWQKMTDAGTNDIPGAINNTYEMAAVTIDDNGSKFSCKITNPTGTTLSNAATLTVTTAIPAAKNGEASGAPVITEQPADLNLKVGEAAKFSVGASGATLSYQWQKTTDAGTNDIPGETNNIYEIAVVTLADNESKFSCKITNPTGTTLSTAAKLSVT
jgi:heme/copper-type cytochrome/quinol oxidase subunit 2